MTKSPTKRIFWGLTQGACSSAIFWVSDGIATACVELPGDAATGGTTLDDDDDDAEG